MVAFGIGQYTWCYIPTIYKNWRRWRLALFFKVKMNFWDLQTPLPFPPIETPSLLYKQRNWRQWSPLSNPNFWPLHVFLAWFPGLTIVTQAIQLFYYLINLNNALERSNAKSEVKYAYSNNTKISLPTYEIIKESAACLVYLLLRSVIPLDLKRWLYII